ncbi:coproporphyrinogen III oxidase [Marinomonas sp. MED121]|uniref:oxygen-independent coproporphyrinogen III oxidase n=1 Tax=Marinomonas sp. MED121 TaxID=314277 RepID=UPI0000690AA1|nr:oxygen-independent coproporphyrinogen III oxidase [Marinomonas sp. MED121]EAQ65887.1 coproporphyrinogen III oxidase [Marinomonas sp. MED121]
MLWNTQLIQKYNISGPRYTSYPTAPQFDANISKLSLIEKMLMPSNKPLSLYFHIPYCAKLCYYCACNKVISSNYKKGDEYLELLIEEIRLKSLMISEDREVRQLHFGGGTPTFLSLSAFSKLMNYLKQNFNMLDNDEGEYSIEVDPREIDQDKLEGLRELGFNRLSFGIQDFNKRVQTTINRVQSYELIKSLMIKSRELRYQSINFDLIYGLPYQTQEGFTKTLNQVIELSPDRISVFNYAHLPKRFASQRLIPEAQLPDSHTKLGILKLCIEMLTNAGYQYIGMDHFAKPNDSLAKAQNQGELKRNFQGYTTHSNCDLIAFGTSAISQIGHTYVQNHTATKDYRKSIENGQLAIMKGYVSNRDDQIRHRVIMSLICNFELDTSEIESEFGIVFKTYFKNELIALQKLEKDGILTLDGESRLMIKVTDPGKLLIRCICMTFDRYLNNVISYSKVI